MYHGNVNSTRYLCTYLYILILTALLRQLRFQDILGTN